LLPLASGLLALMMEAASTSETSVNFYQATRRINPENSHLHTRRSENLKSHPVKKFLASISNPKDPLPFSKYSATGPYSDQL
jgi:hypothetical protein